MQQTLLLLILAGGVFVSVRERKYLTMWRSRPTPAHSPLSMAVAQTVGTAGGIYLSLELLFSFLKIPEDWWTSSAFVVEPLAVISLVLAIVQPFAMKAWMKLRK